MNAPDPQFASLQQAAEWYSVLHSGSTTAQERLRWQAWLAEREEHRQAWAHVENASRRFANLTGEQHREVAGVALRNSQSEWRRKRRALTRLLVLGATGGAIWRFTSVPQAMQALRADYRTGVGEIRKIELPDGTQAWLNTATAINLDYNPATRTVHLLAGEALFETAKDAKRPFVVATAQGRMRALGTRFTVRCFEERTLLCVYEGAVEIRTDAGGSVHTVHAGHQAEFTHAAIGPLQAADRMHEAWSSGVLLADDVPLGEFVTELARYGRLHLGVAPEAAGLRVMGAYPVDDVDKSIDLLADALSLRVRRILPWWITLEPR
jgi:transmembrane sensor